VNKASEPVISIIQGSDALDASLSVVDGQIFDDRRRGNLELPINKYRLHDVNYIMRSRWSASRRLKLVYLSFYLFIFLGKTFAII
jgi:hypothetical protein